MSGQIAQADGAKKEYDVVVQTASGVWRCRRVRVCLRLRLRVSPASLLLCLTQWCAGIWRRNSVPCPPWRPCRYDPTAMAPCPSRPAPSPAPRLPPLLLPPQNDAELVKERVLRLKGEETALKRAHASHSAEVASAGADVEKGLHQLRTALEMYKRLGLTFDSATMDGVEVLKIIFTHIDPRDVTAQFAFAVHVSATDTYKGVCERDHAVGGGRLACVPFNSITEAF